MWLEWGSLCSQGLQGVLVSLAEGTSEGVHWNSGFLHGGWMLWSARCWGSGGALWHARSRGELWGRTSCWFSERAAEIQGNLSVSGFIWYEQENSLGCVSLAEKAHFYHFIGSQTIRITFTRCPFLFKLAVMSRLFVLAQCFISLSSLVANSCALLSFSSAICIFLLLLPFFIFSFSSLLSFTLSSLCSACSLFVWSFGKEEGIYSTHWILLPTVPPIWPLWILQSMILCQIVMLP